MNRYSYLLALFLMISCEQKNTQPMTTEIDIIDQNMVETESEPDLSVINQTDEGFDVGVTITNESNDPPSWEQAFIYGSPATDQVLGLDVLPDLNIVVTGRTEGNLSNQENDSFADGFVAFINQLGELVWLKQLGTEGVDQFLDIVYHPRGAIFTGGFSTGSLTQQINQQAIDGLLVALDMEGNVLWEKLIDLGTINRLTPSPTGVIVVGSYEESAGDYAAFVAEYDMQGERRWLHSSPTSKVVLIGPSSRSRRLLEGVAKD